ncbi:hypothetical protein EV702DRAFT_1048166 [Suillus placidus]|uniref:CHAT domain-containing protein n=1 Tax=Suillus placidus TaxID=48579 RepID=A0A9P6ZPA6_9AGAM|nr:hypothetical protein EV702DRAFT_1048166 [Suillus placidus]
MVANILTQDSTGRPQLHQYPTSSQTLRAQQNSTGSADQNATDRAAIASYSKLTTQWEAVVAEIRNLKGFLWFLLPPSYEDLQIAVCHGSVIILIASEYFCNAIIVSVSGQPHHVPFPSLALSDLEMLKKHFVNVIWDTSCIGPKEPRTALIALLQTIWDEAMTTRVTPSFVAIRQDRPSTGQGMVLAAVDSELELVHKYVPPNVKFTHLSGEEATQASTLEALQCNTWVHLACHGKQNREHPSNSHFATRNKPLTLLNIMENNAVQAEFTFLSACHATCGDEKMPDEGQGDFVQSPSSRKLQTLVPMLSLHFPLSPILSAAQTFGPADLRTSDFAIASLETIKQIYEQVFLWPSGESPALEQEAFATMLLDWLMTLEESGTVLFKLYEELEIDSLTPDALLTVHNGVKHLRIEYLQEHWAS